MLGYALAAFCVLKMFICLKSVLFGDDFTSDPATRALGLALRVFSRGSVTVNVAALSQYITIAFVGFISFNSLRTFLKHVRRAASSVEAFVGGGGVAAAVGGGAGSVTASGSVTGSERAMLGLGALLCAYTVSSVMLLRAQLPVGHRLLVTRALGFDAAAVDSEFDAVHRCAAALLRDALDCIYAPCNNSRPVRGPCMEIVGSPMLSSRFCNIFD